MDRVFLQDENWRCFNAYLAFENYKRDSEASIEIFLSEFNRRYHKANECGGDLPDAVVACRLLKSCNLSDMHFQLALSTTPKVTFEEMRNTLKRLFAESGKMLAASKPDPTQAIVDQKPEVLPALYGEQYSGRPQRYNGNRCRGRENRRGKNYFRGSGAGRGRPGTCFVCGSKDIWARECPRGREGEY